MRKRWLAALLLGVSAVAIAAYAAAARSSTVKSGGTFRLGTSSRIDSLNPYVAFNQDSYFTFEYIYPFLIQYDKANRQFVPDFATSWQISNGGKTWTFRTRKDAKWSDGKPLTARDAAWTINTTIKYKNGGTGNSAGLVAHITKADAPNSTTLVVHYAAAPGNVLGQFQQFPLLPEHVWSKHLGHSGADIKTFANNAPVVGAGPFKLVTFKKDEIALFQKNNLFYGPKPQADAYGLRMFSNDDALVSALKAHEIDAIEGVPATAIKTLRQAKFTITEAPGLDTTDFIFNSNPRKPKHRELLNLKLKAAFDHAIDRTQIVRVVFLGSAHPSGSIIPAAAGSWHNPAVKPASFDLGLANRMLDQLGYRKGSGGIRVANGHQMSYQVITPTDLSSVNRTFQIIQADFQKLGVRLTQKALDSTTATSTIQAPNNKYLNFDLVLWDWTSLLDPDFMLSVVTCAQYGGWSDSGYCDNTYDRMYSQQQLTPNQAKRRALVWRMQSYLAAKRPYIWLVTEDHVSAVTPKWTGYIDSPQGPFSPLSKFSLTQVRQK